MVGCSRHPECDLYQSTGTEGSKGLWLSTVAGPPGPPFSTTSGPDGNAYPTSVGRLNDMGLGIEEPKHDLGWPSLRPLFRDNITPFFPRTSAIKMSYK